MAQRSPQQCFADGTTRKLQAFEGIREPVPTFGFIGNFDRDANTFDYVVAALTRANAEPFEAAVAVELPPLRHAVGTIEGTVPDLFASAPCLVAAELERRKLERHAELCFEMEAYDHRFTHDTATTVIEYWVPLANAS